MDYARAARRESFSLIDETCPKVSKQIDIVLNDYLHLFRTDISRNEILELLGAIMDQVSDYGTTPIRNVLIDQIEKDFNNEEKINELEEKITDLNGEIDYYQRQIKELNAST